MFLRLLPLVLFPLMLLLLLLLLLLLGCSSSNGWRTMDMMGRPVFAVVFCMVYAPDETIHDASLSGVVAPKQLSVGPLPPTLTVFSGRGCFKRRLSVSLWPVLFSFRYSSLC